MLIKKLLFVLVIFTTLGNVKADQILRTFTIKQVFSEGTDTAGFYPNEQLTECKYSLMYIKLNTETGKAIFSMVLSAKASRQKIVRIDYSVDADGACIVSGLHIK